LDVESLVLMGYDGDDPASVQKNEVIVVMDNETQDYTDDKGEKKTVTRARIQWINDPERSVGFIPLSDAEKVVIAGDIRAAVAAHKAATTPPKTVDPAQLNGPKPKF
jgi:S-adenosylmethionine synthetase